MKTLNNNTIDVAILETADKNAAPTLAVLEASRVRAAQFLGALGTVPNLRTAMKRVGYSQSVHAQGWKLYFDANGGDESEVLASREDAAALAVSTIETWEEGGFIRAESALEHMHPDAAQFVFGDGLTSVRGFAAVGSMALFLDRLDALEKAPERKSTRKADHAALATLAERGIDERIRTQLRALVVKASTDAEAKPAALPESAGKRLGALGELHKWLRDWSSTARVVFKGQRGALITLGLAKRRGRKTTPTAPPVAPVVTPPPPANPPVVATPPPPDASTSPVATSPIQSFHDAKEERVPPSRAA